MKTTKWFACFLAVLSSLALLNRPSSVFAAEANPSMDRLERLERRVNEMAERQEQLIRRLSAQMERQGNPGQPAGDPMKPQMAPPAPPHPLAKLAKSIQDLMGLCFLIGVICNISLAVWIFTDIRKRGEGSGIFVALALIAGIPIAVIYSLTRIADKKA